jgi:hypothetical protein
MRGLRLSTLKALRASNGMLRLARLDLRRAPLPNGWYLPSGRQRYFGQMPPLISLNMCSFQNRFWAHGYDTVVGSPQEGHPRRVTPGGSPMRGDPRSTPDDLAVAMWPIAASSSARGHTGDYLRGGHSEPICARFLSCHNFLSQPVSQTHKRYVARLIRRAA